jgi:hypothetical protein
MLAEVFAAGFVTMLAAHQVADHVLGQNDKEAANKAKPGREGWSAILMHVWKYHMVMFFMLLVTCVALQLHVAILGFISAILFSAVSHAFLDRRWPVRWILEHTGSPEFANLQTPINGMYQADQSLHYFCLWISALLLCL